MLISTRCPGIDMAATGANIKRLRVERGYSVSDLQAYFGFEEPQAIYKWQWGKTLPSVDNLYALSDLFRVSMNEILVPVHSRSSSEPSARAGGSSSLYGGLESAA